MRRPRPVDTTRGPAHGIVWMLVLYGCLGAGALGWLCFSCATAHAAELPGCSDTPVPIRFRFRSATAGDPANGFRVYLAAQSQAYVDGTGIDVGAPLPDPEGVRVTPEVPIDLFVRGLYAVMTAYNLAGESSTHSNEIRLAAVPRCTPPLPPPLPVPPPLRPPQAPFLIEAIVDPGTGEVHGRVVPQP